MTLQAEMKVRLDAKPLAEKLVADLAGPLASLGGVRLSAATNGGTASLRAEFVPAQLLGAAANLSGDVAKLLEQLPDPAKTVATLTTALDLVDEVGVGDLRERLTTLFERLGRELEDSAGGNLLAALDRLFGAMPVTAESKQLLGLIDRAMRAAGVGPRPDLGSALPALTATFHAVGALMVLETVLAEGERLAGIMAAQTDPVLAEAELSALRGQFAAAREAVANVVEAGGASAQAVDLARNRILGCAAQLAAFEAHLARAMGFGEATLVYFELARLKGEVTAAVAGLRSVDPDMIANGVRQVVDQMRPLLELQPPGTPAESLEALLSVLESKADTIAGAIDAVDVGAAVAPISRGLQALSEPIEGVTSGLAALKGDVRVALESVRQSVARLPFDDLAGAVHAGLAPVVTALDTLDALVASVSGQLTTTAGTITGALTAVEKTLDDFRGVIATLSHDAATFVENQHLDRVAGEVGGRVREFADSLASVRMGTYFDATASAIDTTAGVIEAIPLSLVPDSMKPDLDAALAPVRSIDVGQVERDIEGLVGIEEGKFALRAVLAEALHEVQLAFDALVGEVAKADPRQLVGLIQPRIDEVAGTVRQAVPEVALGAIDEAIQRAKHALDGVDPREALKPADDAFAQALALIDRYDPAQLLTPLQSRLASTREQVLSALGIESWKERLDALSNEVAALLDRLDPTQLAQVLEPALAEADRLLDTMSRFDLGDVIGDLVASAIAGGGQRVTGRAFRSVMIWLDGAPGSSTLDGRRRRIAASVQQTRTAVRGIDLRRLRVDLSAEVSAMQSVVSHLPDGSSARLQLGAAIGRLTVESRLGPLAANQERYAIGLDEAVAQAEDLGRQGLSEVDVMIDALRAAFAPAAVVREFVRRILAAVGVRPGPGGLAATVRTILQTATPARLVRILEPILTAIRGRLRTLIDAVIAPLKAAIDRVVTLVRAIDLGVVQEGIGDVVAEFRGQIARFAPSAMLGPSLDAFGAVKVRLAAFDPLAPVRATLDALRVTATRVLDKLSAEALLRDPTRIYDEIIAALRALNLEILLAPLLDTLDTIAAEVDGGLDRITGAVVRLQAALPPPGGGGSVSVEAAVSFG